MVAAEEWPQTVALSCETGSLTRSFTARSPFHSDPSWRRCDSHSHPIIRPTYSEPVRDPDSRPLGPCQSSRLFHRPLTQEVFRPATALCPGPALWTPLFGRSTKHATRRLRSTRRARAFSLEIPGKSGPHSAKADHSGEAEWNVAQRDVRGRTECANPHVTAAAFTRLRELHPRRLPDAGNRQSGKVTRGFGCRSGVGRVGARR